MAAQLVGEFAAMALGPTILGHTAYNWALRHVRAYVVSVTVLGEPVGATLLAALIPSIAEVPGALMGTHTLLLPHISKELFIDELRMQLSAVGVGAAASGRATTGT